MNELRTLGDGLDRCWWGTGSSEYVEYHDREWGRPVTARNRLFEKLSLEGFQSGLSWLTILRKRPAFRRAFDDFVPEKVAAFDESDVARLLTDAGIVRHAGKIRAVIQNARRLSELEDEVGALPDWLWREWADRSRTPPSELLSITPASAALSKRLKQAGFGFVGPTTVYAFMQSMGLVNDHLAGCYVREEVERERFQVLAG